MQGCVTTSTDQALAAGVVQTQGNYVLLILIQNLGKQKKKKAFPGSPCYFFDELWFSPAKVPCSPWETEAPS